ncbi:MAG TPA: DUF3108 domain-containing protein [Bacteroidales bacterium]|nr:DUF3108 domain-containing protein [Bacteroidales bacterium]
MKSACLLIPFLIFPLFVTAQSNQDIVKDKPYKSGEKLTYIVKFGPIVGGTASMSIKQSSYKNMPVYHSVAQGRTVGVAEKLYSVKDVFESYFDIHTGLPHRLIRDVKEGNYRKHEEAFFDRKSNTAYSLRLDTTIQVPSEIHDMVSLLYFIRSLNYTSIKAGDVIKTITYFDDEIYPFDIRYKGKEEVKTKYGKIRCHRFDPVVEPGRMFDSEDDMQIWLSDDQNLIPIKVRFDLLVGSLRMELDQFANLKYPLIFRQQ